MLTHLMPESSNVKITQQRLQLACQGVLTSTCSSEPDIPALIGKAAAVPADLFPIRRHRPPNAAPAIVAIGYECSCM